MLMPDLIEKESTWTGRAEINRAPPPAAFNEGGWVVIARCSQRPTRSFCSASPFILAYHRHLARTATTYGAVNLVREYVDWLRQGLTISEESGVYEITTPFLDRHNDHLAIYLRPENDHFVLTDGGYVLPDLEMSGVDINTPKRRQVLDMILRGFGVRREGDELRVEARQDDLPRRKHALLQAMLAVNDMFVMGQEHVLSLFLEDVESFLRLHNIRYVGHIKFTGRSGFDHHFDFAIPASDKSPERLLRALNSPTRDNVEVLCFAWSDTREVREPNTQALAVLNDAERSIGAEALQALKAYQIQPIPWSQREQYVEELLA